MALTSLCDLGREKRSKLVVRERSHWCLRINDCVHFLAGVKIHARRVCKGPRLARNQHKRFSAAVHRKGRIERLPVIRWSDGHIIDLDTVQEERYSMGIHIEKAAPNVTRRCLRLAIILPSINENSASRVAVTNSFSPRLLSDGASGIL